MNEALQLREPLFRLIVRFTNGETVQHVVDKPIDQRLITPDIRYAVITSVSVEHPSQLCDVSIINLRDVTYLKTERVTFEQIASEKRMAGMRTLGASAADEKVVKSLATVSFI
jgi:ribosomal protein L32E